MAITANTKVPTLDYWKLARHIEVGDMLFNKEGMPVKVKLVQHYYVEECYEVTFSDYVVAEGDRHLSFLVEDREYRNKTFRYKGIKKMRRPLKLKSVLDLQEEGLLYDGTRATYSIPTTKPIALPAQMPSIPPFVMGYWVNSEKQYKHWGKKTYRLSVWSILEKETVEKFKEFGYKLKKDWSKFAESLRYEETPSIKKQLHPNYPTYIPENYIMGSIDERLELMQGVFYAKPKSYRPKEDMFLYASSDLKQLKQLQGVLESLGEKTSILHKNTLNYYILKFKPKYKYLPIQSEPKIKVHRNRRMIKQISQLPAQMCVHIEVDNEDPTFLVGEGFIPVC